MIRKLTLFAASLLLFTFSLKSQRQTGLLWQITGNGLAKPSYVYGTMHVSDKVAFHLGDPFFKAIKSVDIVALEQSLDTVYDEWIREQSNMIRNYHGTGYIDYQSFEASEYNKNGIIRVMKQGPYFSNSILYRVSQLYTDFQEETYLDMLIYRLGKKYKKKVTGVEDYMEANRLTSLASAKKIRRKDAMGSGGQTLQDFYRTGDLTAIDSLNKVLYTDHYNEYMLYRRNKNMVDAMIRMMAGGAVFMGVGCAHLPGDEGVLRLLEKKGYKVKAIKSQSNEPSKMLAKARKIKVNTALSSRRSDDNFFSANVPDRIVPIYTIGRAATMYVSLDIPAGGQYLVYRYQDFPSLRNKSHKDVINSLDSFFYEFILGNIDKKIKIENDASLGKNSVGYDIHFTRTNGDKGRYKIFHTGSEIVIVGVTGPTDFASSKEATDFFGSFRLLNANTEKMVALTTADGVITFEAPAAADAPQKLQAVRDWQPDFNYNRDFNGKSYIAMYRNYYNGGRLQADTLEMLLAAESFAYSNKFLEKSAEIKIFKGYPARQSVMTDKDGNQYAVRILLRGYKVFLQALKGSTDFNDPYFTNVVLNKPEVEGPVFNLTDTFCHFTASVNRQASRDEISKKLELIKEEGFFMGNNQFAGTKRLNWFSPENDREFVEVQYVKFSRYDFWKDSAQFWKAYLEKFGVTNLQFLKKSRQDFAYGTRYDVLMGDTGASRRVRAAYILNGDEFISAYGFYDTVSGEGKFTQTFFESFKPLFNNTNHIFTSKVPLWVQDINSKDSTMRRKGWDGFRNLYVDSNYVDYIVKVYDTLHTSSQLVERKRSLIYRFGAVRTEKMIPVLERIYRSAGDTAAYQTAVIGSMATIRTRNAYAKLKQLFFEETPIPDTRYGFTLSTAINDSLRLAATMYPELFDKLDIDEYKDNIISFAAELADSNYLLPAMYKSHTEDLLSEANNLLKKILSAESSKKTTGGSSSNSSDYNKLRQFITLLIPFQSDAKVKTFLDKVKTIKQRDRKMEFFVLMLKNKYPVEDSVFVNLSTNRDYKVSLYNQLDKINRTDKFLAKEKTKSGYSRDVYYIRNKDKYTNGTSTEIDSIFVADSAMVAYWDAKDKKQKSGWVYLVKYNRKKKKGTYDEDKDNEDKEKGPAIAVKKQYYLGLAGPQPLEKDSFNSKRFVLNSTREKAILTDTKQADEFARFIRMGQILALRPGFYGSEWNSWFFGGSDDDD